MGQVISTIAGVAGALGALYGLFLLLRMLIPSIKRKRAISPATAKNKAREKEFLAKILADIQANTDGWFLHDRPGMGNLLANDKRNLGIVYHGSNSTLTILLNLDAVTDFKEHEENTVKISICGDHVKKFIDQAEQLIDKRGSELRYFADEFERRI